MRVRIKICGITRREDAQAAIAAGADAIGLVFYSPSPRNISILQAQAIVDSLPPFITVVGLFVNESRENIQEVLNSVRIDLLQFHGDETPTDCIGYKRPWIKAVPMREGVDLSAIHRRYQNAAALLLDSYLPGIPGGTGSEFNWDRIPASLRSKIILAGGLTVETVGRAVRQISPYAVDVSGGVEHSKGIKDAAKIKAFIRAVRIAE